MTDPKDPLVGSLVEDLSALGTLCEVQTQNIQEILSNCERFLLILDSMAEKAPELTTLIQAFRPIPAKASESGSQAAEIQLLLAKVKQNVGGQALKESIESPSLKPDDSPTKGDTKREEEIFLTEDTLDLLTAQVEALQMATKTLFYIQQYSWQLKISDVQKETIREYLVNSENSIVAIVTMINQCNANLTRLRNLL